MPNLIKIFTFGGAQPREHFKWKCPSLSKSENFDMDRLDCVSTLPSSSDHFCTSLSSNPNLSFPSNADVGGGSTVRESGRRGAERHISVSSHPKSLNLKDGKWKNEPDMQLLEDEIQMQFFEDVKNVPCVRKCNFFAICWWNPKNATSCNEQFVEAEHVDWGKEDERTMKGGRERKGDEDYGLFAKV